MSISSKKPKESPQTLSCDIARLFDFQLRAEMQKNGIKASYEHLLPPLFKRDGVTQLELTKITSLKAPTISTTLRHMETDGLISRKTDEDDGRVTRVYITEKGREVEKKMRAFAAKLEKVSLSGITPEEKEQAEIILNKIKSNMEKAKS